LIAVYYFFLTTAFLLSLASVNRRDSKLRLFIPILGLALLTQIIYLIINSLGQPAMFIFHIYGFLEYPLYALYFYRLFRQVMVRKLLIASVVFFAIFYTTYYGMLKSFWHESFGLDAGITAILMSAFSIYFYVDLIKSNRYYHLPTYPHFYLNSANLIFFSLSLFANCFDARLREADVVLANSVLLINKWSNILMYLLYCAGLALPVWKRKKLSS
jgi:hypothetical protein